MWLEACVIVYPTAVGTFSSVSDESLIEKAIQMLKRYVGPEDEFETPSDDMQFDFWDPETFRVLPVQELKSEECAPSALITSEGRWIDSWIPTPERIGLIPEFVVLWDALKHSEEQCYAVFVKYHI